MLNKCNIMCMNLWYTWKTLLRDVYRQVPARSDRISRRPTSDGSVGAIPRWLRQLIDSWINTLGRLRPEPSVQSTSHRGFSVYFDLHDCIRLTSLSMRISRATKISHLFIRGNPNKKKHTAIFSPSLSSPFLSLSLSPLPSTHIEHTIVLL